MKRRLLLWSSLPAVTFVAACQAIAGLDIPTYVDATSGASSSTGGGSSGEGGGHGGHDGGVVGLGGLVTGQGGNCTIDETFAKPPCPQHIQVWFAADKPTSIEEKGGTVTRWLDLSSSGWTATPHTKGSVILEKNVKGLPGIRFVTDGMTLEQPATGHDFAPAGIGVYAALFWREFGNGSFDFGASQAVCLGSVSHDQRVSFLTTNASGQPRFEVTIHDDATGDDLKDDDGTGVGTDNWGIYRTRYFCDADCADGGTARRDVKVGLSGAPQATSVPEPTLIETSSGWVGHWSASTLGRNCDPAKLPELMNGDIGEVLIYDTYLEQEEMDAMYGYLSHRWTP